jgi:hypothetical protein
VEALEGDLIVGWGSIGNLKGSTRRGLRCQENTQFAVFIFSRQEHALAHFAPELGVLEIGDHHQGQAHQLLGLVVPDDASDDLALLGAQVDLHDQEAIRIGVIPGIQNFGHSEIRDGRVGGGVGSGAGVFGAWRVRMG